MLLLENHHPINLEVLDARGCPLSGMAASLRHLDGEWAVILLTPDAPCSGLRWGACVRFWMADGEQGYEMTGMVVAHDLQTGKNDTPEAASEAEPHEICVRLFESHSKPQQRATPRRRTRFAVRFRPLELSDSRGGGSHEEIVEAEWLRAWCVDVGGGGLRLRADRLPKPPTHALIEFILPARKSGGETHPPRSFCLQARVLRYDISPRRADSVDIALRFEKLSLEDGLALSRFLTY